MNPQRLKMVMTLREMQGGLNGIRDGLQFLIEQDFEAGQIESLLLMAEDNLSAAANTLSEAATEKKDG